MHIAKKPEGFGGCPAPQSMLKPCTVLGMGVLGNVGLDSL